MEENDLRNYFMINLHESMGPSQVVGVFMKMCRCGATGVSVLVCMQGEGFGVFLHSFVFESNIVT